VSILGNPNVGKSTLLNAFLGETLCIVSPKPQTTRHRILGVLTEPKYQLVFSDTPGMVEPVYKLQEAMMESVRGAVGDADVIVLVTDVYGEPLVDSKIMQKLAVTSRPILIVLNKVDLLRGENSINQIHTTVIESNVMKVLDINYNYTNTIPIDKPEIKLSFKQKLLQRKKASLEIFNENEAEKNIISINEIKERIQKEIENTDYDDYKDDYNEREAENDRNWKGSVRSEASEKHLKAKSMSELEAIWKQRLPRAEILLISAQNKIGIQSLLEKVVGFMPQVCIHMYKCV
jgi:GTP-binding protein Era